MPYQRRALSTQESSYILCEEHHFKSQFLVITGKWISKSYVRKIVNRKKQTSHFDKPRHQ